MNYQYDNRAKLPAGTKITCENGHKICETAIDIELGIMGYLHAFTDFDLLNFSPQVNGIVNNVCRSCGSVWIRMEPSGGALLSAKLHTERGWWPMPKQDQV